MILFLYGKDNYRSLQKLSAIKNKFIDASLGDTNLSVFDFSEEKIDFSVLWQAITTPPFLAKSRLIVIKNLLISKNKKIQEEIEKKLTKIPDNSFVVFYENDMPDRRSGIFKKLNKPKISQSFNPLERSELLIWTKNKFDEREALIEKNALDKLLDFTGSDLWKLSNEIDKLSLFNKKIIVKDVELLVKSNEAGNIFDFVDSLMQKNTKKSYLELKKLLDSGENELYIFTMIVYGIRNLAITKDLVTKNYSQVEIQKQSGIHPFALRKIINFANNFTVYDIKRIYSQLAEYDFCIKSGKIEPRLALSLLIFEITSPYD